MSIGPRRRSIPPLEGLPRHAARATARAPYATLASEVRLLAVLPSDSRAVPPAALYQRTHSGSVSLALRQVPSMGDGAVRGGEPGTPAVADAGRPGEPAHPARASGSTASDPRI